MARIRGKRTKVVCTIGPASMTQETIKRMHAAGMDVVRINTAHGDFEQYDSIIEMTRSVDKITIDDGTIGAIVERKHEGKLHLRVLDQGVIQLNKGVNIPGKRLNVPRLSEKDLKAIEYAIDKNVEFLALSFARDASDVAN